MQSLLRRHLSIACGFVEPPAVSEIPSLPTAVRIRASTSLLRCSARDGTTVEYATFSAIFKAGGVHWDRRNQMHKIGFIVYSGFSPMNLAATGVFENATWRVW